MWLIVLSDQLPIVALVGFYPTNQLIGRGPIPERPSQDFAARCSRNGQPMRYCRPFLAGIPHSRVGHPRVPHPSATRSPALLREKESAFDLHVLGTPPAFILSQDQTRHPNLWESLSGDSRVWLWSRLLAEPRPSCNPGQVGLLTCCYLCKHLACSQMWSIFSGHCSPMKMNEN